VLILLAAAAVLGARLLWQRRPNVLTCGLFWGTALAINLVGWTGALSGYLICLAVLCNGSVTLANGGFMPVALHRRLNSRARSLWVERHSGQRLLFLADNFGNSFIRFSVGDVILLVGVLLGLLGE
jgi:hypothetical protein